MSNQCFFIARRSRLCEVLFRKNERNYSQWHARSAPQSNLPQKFWVISTSVVVEALRNRPEDILLPAAGLGEGIHRLVEDTAAEVVADCTRLVVVVVARTDLEEAVRIHPAGAVEGTLPVARTEAARQVVGPRRIDLQLEHLPKALLDGKNAPHPCYRMTGQWSQVEV